MYDNARGVCDWPDEVVCEYTEASSGGKNGTASGEGNSGNLGEKISAIDVNTANTAGSNGATANMGWQGGSDWGGRWIDGVWYVVHLMLVILSMSYFHSITLNLLHCDSNAVPTGFKTKTFKPYHSRHPRAKPPG